MRFAQREALRLGRTKERVQEFHMSVLAGHKRLVWVLVVMGSLVLLSVLWPASASVRGRLAADIDVARGKYEVQGYGLPAPWVSEYARLLRERYGVQFRAVAGCTVTKSLVSYVDAYDRVSSTAAKRKFGRDIFRESADEARTTRERRVQGTP